MGFDDLFSPEYSTKLKDELEKLSGNEKKSYQDDRIWQAQTDKVGNGYAVIRFLPPVDGESVPAVKRWHHGFKGPGGSWYIENCLTTIGQNDPVADANTELWNTGIESNKQIARDRKRKLSYYSNVYIVSDPANPDNEGKVFIFKYGMKIYEKLEAVMHPDEIEVSQGVKSVNPFDLINGADFRLRITKDGRFSNYDKSNFADVAPLLDGDKDKLKEVWESEFALQTFIAPDQFKPYDELKEKFERIIGVPAVPEARVTAEEMDIEDDIPIGGDEPAEEQDALSRFRQLAEED